ncbi:MAG TPA: type I secretion system permease/ATPase [Hyphomicrobiaceae bacterium]|nr:type I secretion system permease/ATPase [Hyphomicrobiaceae bacterium]
MSRINRGLGRRPEPIREALRPDRATRWTLVLTSGLVNVLTLTGSLFMMQVYDRVLGSQSVPTLVGLALIAIFAYVLQGNLEAMRQRILVLLSEKFDSEIGPRVASANLQLALRSVGTSQPAIRYARQVEDLRAFVAGPGPIAALDLPWLPIYLFVVFILHWSLALAIVVAACFLVWLTVMTERRSRTPAMAAQEAAQRRAAEADVGLRNAEAIQAMGMRSSFMRRWTELHESYLGAQRAASFAVGGFTVAARTSRLMLQSVVLGLGAYLAIQGVISAGAIIAASILSARALAPIDQAIAAWKPFVAAREAYKSLTDLLVAAGNQREPLALDPPKSALAVADLMMTVPVPAPPPGVNPPPGQSVERTVLQGVKFGLSAGDSMAIIGPSASGKSTLARALVGVWTPRMGTVKLDGATLDQWSPERLGRHIGYLPQDVQLFDGTIAENIARFDPDAADDEIIAAARAAAFHDYILQTGGYDRRIGPSGASLSAGQRQRLGLARALYGNPFLVVLDEPNSNLDIEGKAALQSAIEGLTARGGIAVIVSHDTSILDSVKYVLALDRGRQVAFDTSAVVLERLGLRKPAASPAPVVKAPPPSSPPVHAQSAAKAGSPVAPRTATTTGQQFVGPRFVLQSATRPPRKPADSPPSTGTRELDRGDH